MKILLLIGIVLMLIYYALPAPKRATSAPVATPVATPPLATPRNTTPVATPKPASWMWMKRRGVLDPQPTPPRGMRHPGSWN